MSLDQWIILIFGPSALGFSFTEKYRYWGPVSGMIGQGAWWVTLVNHAQWGAVIASVAYQAAWIYGLWNFRKEYACLLRNWIDLVTFWLSSEDSMTKRLQPSVPTYETFSSPSSSELTGYSNGCVNYTSQATDHIDRSCRLGC